VSTSGDADRVYLARALELAARGLYTCDPNPRVGCVLVRDGRIVGEGWHVRAGQPHAEVHALRAAGAAARGATAYVTLEPCRHHGRTPPCTEALIGAGVARVVAAMEDPDPRTAGQGLEMLRAAGLEVECGLLAAEAEALNRGFVMRHRRGRPWVTCKAAMTLDGRTATAAGESRWITSAAARRDVQRLRARSSAVMTGIGTVLADDPSLTVRPDELGPQADWDRQTAGALDGPPAVLQPLRVVVDSGLRLPAGGRLLTAPGALLIATVSADERPDLTARAELEICRLPAHEGRVDPAALLAALAGRGINELLLEAGPRLCGAMLQAQLVDEVVIYLAPRLLGDAAMGLFSLPGLERLDQAVELAISDIRAVGCDWRITARPRYPGPPD